MLTRPAAMTTRLIWNPTFLLHLLPSSMVDILMPGGDHSPSLDHTTPMTTPSAKSMAQISTLANGHKRSTVDDRMKIQVARLIKVRENPMRIFLGLRVHHWMEAKNQTSPDRPPLADLYASLYRLISRHQIWWPLLLPPAECLIVTQSILHRWSRSFCWPTSMGVMNFLAAKISYRGYQPDRCRPDNLSHHYVQLCSTVSWWPKGWQSTYPTGLSANKRLPAAWSSRHQWIRSTLGGPSPQPGVLLLSVPILPGPTSFLHLHLDIVMWTWGFHQGIFPIVSSNGWPHHPFLIFVIRSPWARFRSTVHTSREIGLRNSTETQANFSVHKPPDAWQREYVARDSLGFFLVDLIKISAPPHRRPFF